MSNTEKNSRIREKGKATRAKRKDQTAKVYEIKFDKSKISKQRSDSVSYKDYKVRKVNMAIA
ncbi:MAG: hypothetical protein QXS81_04205 [Candidatus Micrarchaeaceae archaeon]